MEFLLYFCDTRTFTGLLQTPVVELHHAACRFLKTADKFLIFVFRRGIDINRGSLTSITFKMDKV